MTQIISGKNGIIQQTTRRRTGYDGDGDIWKKHFENLYSTTTLNLAHNDLLNKLQILESVVKDNQNPLDYQITEEELPAKIQTLQPRMASGPDSSLNEMLKFKNQKFNIVI